MKTSRVQQDRSEGGGAPPLILNSWCFFAGRLWSPSSYSLRIGEENLWLRCGCLGHGLASVDRDCFPEPQVGLHTVSAGFQADKGLRSGLELLPAQGRTQGPPVGSAGALRVEGCAGRTVSIFCCSRGDRQLCRCPAWVCSVLGIPLRQAGSPGCRDSPSLLPVGVLGCVGVRSECTRPALTPPWPGGAPGSAPAATALLFPAQQLQWGFWVWDLFFFPTHLPVDKAAARKCQPEASLGLLGLGGPRLHQNMTSPPPMIF